MADAVTHHSVSENTWIRQMEFKNAGDEMQGHKHTFDHQTLFTVGEFEIEVEGEGVVDITAPSIFITRAGQVHRIVAKTDNALAYCIHALRDGEKMEDIMDPKDICEGWHENDTTPLMEGGRGELFYKPAVEKAVVRCKE